MAQHKVFKLHFLTPLHVGLGRSEYDSSSSDLHSDTITSALAAMKAQRGASSEEIYKYLDSITMSSAFPYEEELYFLPRPLTSDRIFLDGQDSTEHRKKLKKVRYIESSVWQKFLNTEVPSIQSTQLAGEYILPLGYEGFVKPFSSQVTQRVSVARGDGLDSSPFFFEWCYFNNERDCGLYVIVDATTDEVLVETKSLLEELGYTGIGTDKTVGGGQFEVKEGTIDLPDSKSDRWLSLSLYLPARTEQSAINMQDSCYNIQLRGGYMAGSGCEELRHLWKRSIYMYQEGSVFYCEDCPSGVIVDLRPQWNDARMHPVYRSGKAMFVPIKSVKQ